MGQGGPQKECGGGRGRGRALRRLQMGGPKREQGGGPLLEPCVGEARRPQRILKDGGRGAPGFVLVRGYQQQ